MVQTDRLVFLVAVFQVLHVSFVGGFSPPSPTQQAIRLQASTIPDDMISLSQYLDEEKAAGYISEELVSVIKVLESSCRRVSVLLSRASLDGSTQRAPIGHTRSSSTTSSEGPGSKTTSLASASSVFEAAFTTTPTAASVLAIRTHERPMLLAPECVENDREGGVGSRRGSSRKHASRERFSVVVDPLDGGGGMGQYFDEGTSDLSISTGSVFGVFPLSNRDEVGGSDASAASSSTMSSSSSSSSSSSAAASSSAPTLESAVCRPGSELVAAGCCMYSSSTMLLLATNCHPGEQGQGQGPNEIGPTEKGRKRLDCFTLDPTCGEFLLTHPDLKCPPRGATYSVNEGLAPLWPPGFSIFLRDAKTGHTASKKRFSARFVGSIVPDVHRTLLYGGLFAAPPLTLPPNKDKDKTQTGTVSLVFTAAPLALLAEQAEGFAFTGNHESAEDGGPDPTPPSARRVLSTKPDSLHATTGLYLGSAEDVAEATGPSYLAAADVQALEMGGGRGGVSIAAAAEDKEKGGGVTTSKKLTLPSAV